MHHPSYSPDLMYEPMKEHLRGQKCQTDKESKRGVLNCISSRDKTFYAAGLSNLPGLKKLHGLSPQANYTDRATAACWRSWCQLLWIEGATWSA
jgi:hypothetical protein